MTHLAKALEGFKTRGSSLSEAIEAVRKDADELCTCSDVFSCPHGGRIDEVSVARETEERERKRRMGRKKR